MSRTIDDIPLDEVLGIANPTPTTQTAKPPQGERIAPKEANAALSKMKAQTASRRAAAAQAGAAGVDAALSAISAAQTATPDAAGFAAVAEGEKSSEKRKAFEAANIRFEDAADFMARELPPFDWIVPNLIATAGRQGCKGDLFGKSKTSKTWLALQLAHCVATGKRFLAWDIPRTRKVAYFNLELIPTGEQERMRDQQTALGISREELRGRLYVVNLRNRGHELRKHTEAVADELRRLEIDLCILDPRYKLVEDGEDENTAAGLRGVLNFRDAISEVCAVLVVGHDPKGDVGEKSITDRGAGSYTAGADFDFCFALSPHEEDGYTVLSASSRYRKSPEDVTLSWDEQGGKVFYVEKDIPAVKRTGKGGGGDSSRMMLANVVTALKEKPNYRAGLVKAGFCLDSPAGRRVWKIIVDNPSTFGLVAAPATGTKMTFYGLSPHAEKAADEAATNYKNCREAQK